jgi:hypothetical protein
LDVDEVDATGEFLLRHAGTSDKQQENISRCHAGGSTVAKVLVSLDGCQAMMPMMEARPHLARTERMLDVNR